MGDVVQVSNAVEELNARLAAKHARFPQSEPFRPPFVQPYVREVSIIRTSEIVFDQELKKTLPVKATLITKRIRPCADVVVNSTLDITEQVAKGWRVSKTRTVATQIAIKATGRVDIKLEIVSLGFSREVSWQQTLTNAETNETSETTTATIRVNDSIALKPFKAIMIQALIAKTEVVVPFKFTATVDGELFPMPGQGSFLDDYNHRGASYFLSEEERTFEVSGELHFYDATDALLNITPLSCDGQAVGPDETRKELLLDSLGLAFAGKFKRPASSVAYYSSQMAGIEGAGIGAPDGIHYEVLYTSQITRPAIECGINDIGLPNPGTFEVEHRQYTEWKDGEVIRTWQEEADERLLSCVSI